MNSTQQRRIFFDTFTLGEYSLVVGDSLTHTVVDVDDKNINIAVPVVDWSVGNVYAEGTLLRTNGLVYIVVISNDVSTVTPTQVSTYSNFETSDGYVWRLFANEYASYTIGGVKYSCIFDSLINTPVNGSVFKLSSTPTPKSNVEVLTQNGIGAVPVIGSQYVYFSAGGKLYSEATDIVSLSDYSNGTGANVKLTITNGEVSVESFDTGMNYQAASKVVVIGDGSSVCELDVTVFNGNIVDITVTNAGSGYTTATAYIVPTDAVVSNIICEPANGIGYDILSLEWVDYTVIITKEHTFTTPQHTEKVSLVKRRTNTLEDFVVYSVNIVNDATVTGTHELFYVLKYPA